MLKINHCKYVFHHSSIDKKNLLTLILELKKIKSLKKMKLQEVAMSETTF